MQSITYSQFRHSAWTKLKPLLEQDQDGMLEIAHRTSWTLVATLTIPETEWHTETLTAVKRMAHKDLVDVIRRKGGGCIVVTVGGRPAFLLRMK